MNQKQSKENTSDGPAEFVLDLQVLGVIIFLQLQVKW